MFHPDACSITLIAPEKSIFYQPSKTPEWGEEMEKAMQRFRHLGGFRHPFFLMGLFWIGMCLLPQGAGADVLASDDDGVLIVGDPSENTSASADSIAEDLLSDQADHKASVVSFEGTVYAMKKGESSWAEIQQAAEVHEGDKIRTDAGATAEIAYDSTLLNLTHLKENTVAEFRSIEPTDVYLEDGTLFNALDGLDADSSYQVSTPTYVAAVRGTHFDVQFDQATQQFSAATLSPEEGVGSSKIFVSDPNLGASAETLEVREGNQIDVPRGQRLLPEFVQAAAPQRIQAAHEAFSNFRNRMPQFDEQRKMGREKMEKRREFMAERQAGRPGQPSLDRLGGKNSGQTGPEIGKDRRERIKESFDAGHDRREGGRGPQNTENAGEKIGKPLFENPNGPIATLGQARREERREKMRENRDLPSGNRIFENREPSQPLQNSGSGPVRARLQERRKDR